MAALRHLVFAFIITKIPTATRALYGYDCGEQLSNLTTISLLDVGVCELKQPKANITKMYGQLLQINDFRMIPTFACSIKITRIITYCGMHSHASRTVGGEVSYYKDISRDECRKMQESGYLSLYGVYITEIPRNRAIQRQITFAGSADSRGNCEGGSFSDPYGTYNNVYVAGWVEIKLSSEPQRVQLESNHIKLDSGVVCTFSDGTCIDTDASQVFWSLLPEDTCQLEKYSILHEGTIYKLYDADEDQTVYSLETNDITFALIKKGETNICGYKIEATEHPKLFIIENAREKGFVKRDPTLTANMDIFAYVNSKFLYVEKYIRKQLNLMYRDIIQHRCELERQVLSNALALAATSPEEAAYRIMKGPGYLAVTAGEVLHLVKCLKVEVFHRETKLCYEQLPIYKDKEEYFLTPRTRLVVRAGRQIPCDRNLPAMYRLNNIWFKMLPEAVEVKNPEMLHPHTRPTWKYVSPTTLAISGIYSSKDLNRLRDMMLFPIERPAVLNRLALGLSGRDIDSEGVTINKLLNQAALEALAESTWNKMWIKFMTFGTASAGIIGLIMLCRLIKLLIDTIIHGYAIYSLYGFSIHLIGAIWNSVTQLLLHLGQRRQNNRDNSVPAITNEDRDNENTENEEPPQSQKDAPSTLPRKAINKNTADRATI